MDRIDFPKQSEKIIAYLTKKKAWEFDFIKYSQIKKTIMFITKIKKTYIIRKLFLQLVDDKIFLKKKNKNVKSYLYKFKNNNEANIKKKTITITFD